MQGVSILEKLRPEGVGGGSGLGLGGGEAALVTVQTQRHLFPESHSSPLVSVT